MERLTRANLRLVARYAHDFCGQGLPLMDLVQEGCIGLLRAAERFDHRRGFRFSTYATWWIRQGIKRALMNQSRMIRLPVHANETVGRLLEARRVLTQRTGQEPGPTAIAEVMRLPPGKVRGIIRVMQPIASLDAPIGDDVDLLAMDQVADEQAPDPREEADRRHLQEELRRLLATLSTQEQQILRLRFGFDARGDHTLQEIAESYGLSRERIRQIETQALQKLRRRALRGGLEQFKDSFDP
jgi:RNA polymerase primary sigma factor